MVASSEGQARCFQTMKTIYIPPPREQIENLVHKLCETYANAGRPINKVNFQWELLHFLSLAAEIMTEERNRASKRRSR